jgi:hypothetical protein
MPERSTLASITFSHPFSLTDVDGVQPAGTYTVETIETTLDNLSFLAYRRVSTSIMLPAIGKAARERQVIYIDPLELEQALKRDAQTWVDFSNLYVTRRAESSCRKAETKIVSIVLPAKQPLSWATTMSRHAAT